jgi:hypothetical protein
MRDGASINLLDPDTPLWHIAKMNAFEVLHKDL